MSRWELRIDQPSWIDAAVDWTRPYRTDDEKVRLTISLARENVVRETGGPFGAAIFQADTGRLVAVGVNSVVRLLNSALHGEMIAFMMAQRQLQSLTLAAPGLPTHELATSSEPCAMCLGATLWSGVKRVVFGAEREHAENVGFDEGPVFPESYQYLRDRGIEIVGGVLREEARAVLELYRSRGGPIYNA
jgi:tRNA(Arg) A34 adenosine deaminase TadA